MPRVSEKERRLLIRAGIGAAVVAVLLFVDVPLYTSARRQAARAADERARLASIVSMAHEYLSVTAEVDDIQSTAFTGGGAALAGIDAIVTRSGSKKKVASVRATTKPMGDGMKAVKAEVSLARVSLAELSGLIGALESDGHPVAIERIAVKAAYDEPSVFDATLIVNTVERD